ncbi:hypothetical protein CMEL01_03833, partial [Colletotrichum melonis]
SAGQSFSTPYLIVAGCKYLIICIIKRFGSVGHDARRNGLPVSITFQCQSELRGSQSRCEICSIPRIKRRRCALAHREEHCLFSNLPLYAWDSHFRSSDKAPSAPAEFSFTDNPIIYLSVTQLSVGGHNTCLSAVRLCCQAARYTDRRSSRCKDLAFVAVGEHS